LSKWPSSLRSRHLFFSLLFLFLRRLLLLLLFCRKPSPFCYLFRLRHQTKKLAATEIRKAKLEWLNGEGNTARIGGTKVSLSDLRKAAEKTFAQFTKLVDELTFKARLPLVTAWTEDYAKEDPNNLDEGFSPIKDRSDLLLHRLADAPHLRGKVSPPPCNDLSFAHFES
jgi:hypothetical protein